MGKMALILTMGMSVIIAFFVLRLNSNSKEGLSTTVNMFQNTQARLTANSGVEIYLEKMRKDKNLNSGTFLNNTLLDATYDIYITPGTNDSVTIRSVAYFMGVSHETIVKAVREPAPFPITPAALYVSSAAVQAGNSGISGNFLASGYDHSVVPISGGKYPPISTDPTNPNIVPGILVDNASDVDLLKAALGGSSTTEGLGGTPSIVAKDYDINWEGISNEIAFSADRTLETGVYNNSVGSLGTYDKPQITLVNGNATFTGGLTGAGILILNGDIEIKGGFDFKGIVIAYKKSAISMEIVGGATVLGSFIVSGSSVNMSITGGTFNALYSTEALNNAKLNLKSSRFKILSWWE